MSCDQGPAGCAAYEAENYKKQSYIGPQTLELSDSSLYSFIYFNFTFNPDLKQTARRRIEWLQDNEWQSLSGWAKAQPTEHQWKEGLVDLTSKLDQINFGKIIILP